MLSNLVVTERHFAGSVDLSAEDVKDTPLYGFRSTFFAPDRVYEQLLRGFPEPVLIHIFPNVFMMCFSAEDLQIDFPVAQIRSVCWSFTKHILFLMLPGASIGVAAGILPVSVWFQWENAFFFQPLWDEDVSWFELLETSF